METTTIIVRRALRSKHISPRAMFEIEKRGAESFHEIAKVLDEEPSCSDLAKINALKLMAQITRESYMEGKPALIQIGACLAEDPSEQVRSASVHSIIHNLWLLEQLPRLKEHVPEANEIARRAVFAALDLGVDAMMRDMADRAIEQRGWRQNQKPQQR